MPGECVQRHAAFLNLLDADKATTEGKEEEALFPASGAQPRLRHSSCLLQSGVGKDQAVLVSDQPRRVLPISSGCKFTVGQWPKCGPCPHWDCAAPHSACGQVHLTVRGHEASGGVTFLFVRSLWKQVNFKGKILVLKRNKGILLWPSKRPSFQLAFLSSGCSNLSHNHVTIANKWQLQSP